MLLDYELVMGKLDTMEYRERLSLVFAQLKTYFKNYFVAANLRNNFKL